MAREELLSTRSDKENKPTDTQRLENLKQSDNNTAEQDGPIEATKEELKPIKNCDQRQMTGSEGHLTIQNQTDEEKNQTFFRLKDFEAHLRKNKFFEYKSHKIAQRLRELH